MSNHLPYLSSPYLPQPTTDAKLYHDVRSRACSKAMPVPPASTLARYIAYLEVRWAHPCLKHTAFLTFGTPA